MDDFRSILAETSENDYRYGSGSVNSQLCSMEAARPARSPEEIAKAEAEYAEREARRRQTELATVVGVVALRHFAHSVCQPNFDIKETDTQWERSCAVAEAIRTKAQSLRLPSHDLTNCLIKAQ